MMAEGLMYLNQILQGDCIEILNSMPEKCADLVFADPPYFLQLKNDLFRPNETLVDGVDDAWDQFRDSEEYDNFTKQWLSACQRVLKDDGTIWVIGTYHNIYRVGKILLDLGYWILNDIVWVKTNPMPNFRGVRFANAHETLIWAQKKKDQSRHTFNYWAAKNLNEGLQMRSDWVLPICGSDERLKINGKKAHSTQKPEALLYRVILSASNVGDVVLDPFFGTGTTGVVAKKLKRNWIGIERDPDYAALARNRLEQTKAGDLEDFLLTTPSRRGLPRVPFGLLVETGKVRAGQLLFSKDGQRSGVICADGSIRLDGFKGSIHECAAQLQGKRRANGWEFWCYNREGILSSIDLLRLDYLKENYRIDGLL